MKANSTAQFNVLEIIGNAVIGGVEKQVYNLVQRLPNYGFNVTCLAPYESEYTASLRQLGAQVFLTDMHVNVPLKSLQFTMELVNQHRIDLIHAHLPRAQMLAGLVGRLTNRPAVATFHGMELTGEELGIAKITRSYLLTVCQPAYMQALALGIPPEQVSLIPNGVDVKRFHPKSSGSKFRLEYGIPVEAVLVGFVGRFSYEKGPDLFVQVAKVVHEKYPDVHFVMVGDGPMREEIQTLIQEAQLASVFHLTGMVKNTPDVYPALDIHAVTSRVEGMPLTVLESMACGVPSLAMSVGGLLELVEVRTTGFTSAPEDTAGLADALLIMLDDPEKLKAMGKAARKRVEEKFDLDQSLLLTADLFNNLLQIHAPSKVSWQTGGEVEKPRVQSRNIQLKKNQE